MVQNIVMSVSVVCVSVSECPLIYLKNHVAELRWIFCECFMWLCFVLSVVALRYCFVDDVRPYTISTVHRELNNDDDDGDAINQQIQCVMQHTGRIGEWW